MSSRFHLIPERNGQTGGRTDGFAVSISHVSILTRDEKSSTVSVTLARCVGVACFRHVLAEGGMSETRGPRDLEL